MSTEFTFPDPPASVAAQARSLADAIERLLAGGAPTAADLAGAPVLDLYRPALRAAPGLIGVVGGHPRLRDRRTVVTSELFAIDRASGWARTWSRFYALGRPLDCAGGRRQ